MNRDSVIVELLSRIQALEEQVEALSSGTHLHTEAAPAPAPALATQEETAPAVRSGPKVSTSDIRNYIQEQKRLASENGESELILKASGIHRALSMKNRIPMVTNAMRQCMSEGDEVLHDTPSGKSSTLEIKYYLSNAAEEDDDDEDYED